MAKAYIPTKDAIDELNAAINSRYEDEPNLLSMHRSINFENENKATVTFRCRNTGSSPFATFTKDKNGWYCYKDWKD